ncbi:probable disease resistance protein RF9 [Salvia miltiorrhiza]|uniref:probable disease resistance protein RF9 n=1 Tax=Salvia miltiorrhiza TaxID=226208 RepID=UPI0025AD644D|nr:probable disease resistance protein RF9 [Salvia miltiorrhiza]
MSDIICMEPLQIDDLKNLQTLTYISADNLTYELLRFQKMDNLRKLGIQEVDRITDVSKILASLAMVKNLDCLILKGSRFRRMSSLDELCSLNRLTQLKLDGLLTKLPSATDFPPDIRYMSLVNTSLDEDPMPVLEKLSKLQILNLRNAFMGEEMMVSHLGFAELEGLCMGELWRLRNLQVGEGAMPKLKRLEINNCPYLETLPKEMANLKELKMVTTKGIARKILEAQSPKEGMLISSLKRWW